MSAMIGFGIVAGEGPVIGSCTPTLTWVEHDLDAFAKVLSGERSLNLVVVADMTMGQAKPTILPARQPNA